MKKKTSSNWAYLSPILTIKNSHLNKTDVKNIKFSLLTKICVSSLLTAVLVLLINLISLFSMGIETGWNQIEVYGLPSVLGQAISITGTVCVIIFSLIATFSKNEKIKNNFGHIANVLVFVVMVIYFFLSFYADLKQGFLSVTPTLSPSIALIPFFLLIQPVFWVEAIILDGILSFGIIGLSIYFTSAYDMQGLMYYLFIAIFLPVVSYLIISLLFYAETQRYCEELRNEALYNTATYDELTLCRNRHALKDTIEKYSKKSLEDNGTSLLVMMFDIDNFKLYNDQYSHIGGDYCLKAIADCVRKAFPSPALEFYRYGGEEFLLIQSAENFEEASVIIERLRIAIQNLKIEAAKGAPDKYVTISIGGTFINVDAINDFNEVIKNADENLYLAKGNGKNLSVIDGKPIR